jgi:hypothetical protein
MAGAFLLSNIAARTSKAIRKIVLGNRSVG